MRLRSPRRRVILGTVLAIAMVVGTVGWLVQSAANAREAEVQHHIGLGLAFADSLERTLGGRSPGAISTPEATAALYLERLRLGLGSPFRLIDQALRDPDLEHVGRKALAEAMLARTLHGDAYRTESAALDLIENNAPGHGGAHLAVIDSVVATADNPRVGELTVRLAYRLATASGALSQRAPEIAAAAAAQARDGVLAARDARALVGAADRGDVGRFTLLRMWRETRRFAVERPVIAPLTAREEREAIARLPFLVTRIELIAEDGTDQSGLLAPVAVGGPSRRTGDGLASRMAAVAQQRDAPPQAPVVIAVSGHSALINAHAIGASSIPRHRFVSRAVNERTLAAEWALLRARTPEPVAAAGLAVLTAGVALRPYAQESAWLPGDAAPALRDLQSRLGVAVTFDRSVRAAWRPVLQRDLELAIDDLHRVLPAFDPRGLRVHFGPSPLGERALAMHDPINRTIYLPVVSSSGVMAHEFAHDLDWQAARREFGGSGWYRTDHAVRQSSDVLAGALRQMASATRGDARRASSTRDRPTEVFARNVDWYVSVALAREGRINGHLSAVQDPVLTGYAAAITPEAARAGGSATLRALDRLTTVPGPAHSWFSSHFGAERRLSVHEAMRQVLETPARTVDLRSEPATGAPFEATRGLFAAAPEVSDAWRCFLDGFSERGTDAAAVRAIVLYAAEARARGLIRMWSEFARRNPARSPARLRALTGGPWDPAVEAAAFRQIRDGILWSALTDVERDVRDPFTVSPSPIRAAWSC